MPKPVTIDQILQQATLKLSHTSTSARVDAEVLLMHVLSKPRAYLYTWPEQVLTNAQLQQLTQLIRQRSHGRPIAYLVGQREFWSLPLTVTPATLIPRPETELLVDYMLKHLPNQPGITVADLGTGSGAIALALANERPDWQIYATDISPAALSVARRNAKKLNVKNISFCHGHWFGALPDIQFDGIVANPPYLSAHEHDSAPGDLCFEPQLALVAAQQGYAAYDEIIKRAPQYLKPNGVLCLEHGSNQQHAVLQRLRQTGFHQVAGYDDLAGLARMVCARCCIRHPCQITRTPKTLLTVSIDQDNRFK